MLHRAALLFILGIVEAQHLPDCDCYNFRNQLTTDHVGERACARKEVHGNAGERTWCALPSRPFVPLIDNGCAGDLFACTVTYKKPNFPSCGCTSYVNGASRLAADGLCKLGDACYPRVYPYDKKVGGADFFGCPENMVRCDTPASKPASAPATYSDQVTVSFSAAGDESTMCTPDKIAGVSGALAKATGSDSGAVSTTCVAASVLYTITIQTNDKASVLTTVQAVFASAAAATAFFSSVGITVVGVPLVDGAAVGPASTPTSAPASTPTTAEPLKGPSSAPTDAFGFTGPAPVDQNAVLVTVHRATTTLRFTTGANHVTNPNPVRRLTHIPTDANQLNALTVALSTVTGVKKANIRLGVLQTGILVTFNAPSAQQAQGVTNYFATVSNLGAGDPGAFLTKDLTDNSGFPPTLLLTFASFTPVAVEVVEEYQVLPVTVTNPGTKTPTIAPTTGAPTPVTPTKAPATGAPIAGAATKAPATDAPVASGPFPGTDTPTKAPTTNAPVSTTTPCKEATCDKCTDYNGAPQADANTCTWGALFVCMKDNNECTYVAP